MRPARVIAIGLFVSAIVPATLTAQQERLPVRIAISYEFAGPLPLDTAAASRRFLTALTADSLLRILPLPTREQITDPNRPRDGGATDSSTAVRVTRIEGARVLVSLTITVLEPQALVRVRAVEVLSGQLAFRDSMTVGGEQALSEALDTLGRRVAKALAPGSSARPPN